MTSGNDDHLVARLSGAGQRFQRSGQDGFLLVSRVPSKSRAITRVVMCYFRLMLKSDLAMMVHRRGVRTNFSTSAVNVCMPFVPPSVGNSAGDASIMGGCLIIFGVQLS